jgi:hypothetical protein
LIDKTIILNTAVIYCHILTLLKKVPWKITAVFLMAMLLNKYHGNLLPF